MLPLLVFLLYLSMVGAPVLLFACQVKKTRKDGAGTPELVKTPTKHNKGPAPPPDDPGRKGDKQSDSRLFDPISRTDRLALKKSKVRAVEEGAEQTAKSKVSAMGEKLEEKAEKDKSAAEKTNYNVTEYLNANTDRTDLQGKTKTATKATKEDQKEEEKKKEDKSALPADSKTQASAATAQLTPASAVKNGAEPADKPASPAKVAEKVSKARKVAQSTKKVKAAEGKKEEKKEEEEDKLDKSQIESVIQQPKETNEPKQEVKASKEMVEMDDALDATPPSPPQEEKKFGDVSKKGPQFDKTQYQQSTMTQLGSDDTKKKHKKKAVKILGTQGTDGSSFYKL